MSVAIANQMGLAFLGRGLDVALSTNTGALLNGGQPPKALLDAWFDLAILDGAFSATDTTSTVVNKVFNNIFGRDALPFEQDAWGDLTTGDTGLSLGELVWGIWVGYLGATNVPDEYKIPAQSRLIATEAYTNALANNADANAAVSQIGSPATVEARLFLDGVDTQAEAAAKIAGAQAAVDGTTTTGSVFKLTTGVDQFVGTSGNDTFDATLVNEGGVANNQTLGVTDTLNGGQGTDTLNFVYNTAVTPFGIQGIENIIITDADAGTEILDFINVTGATSITSLGSVGAVDLDNLTAIPELVLQNQGVNVDIDFVDSVVSGAADAITVTLNTNTDGDVTIEGVETVNLVSAGSNANTLDINDTGTTLTTVNISGSADLTLNDSTALEAEVTTVNAGTATGDVAIFHNGNAAVVTLTGGSGDDTFDLSGTFFDGTTAATADTVDGGAGANRLILTSAEAAAVGSAAEFSRVTNIQTVVVDDDANGDNISMVNLGITTLEFDNLVGAHTVTAVSGGEVQFDFADNATDARTYTISGTGTSDSLTFDINGVDIGDGTQTLNGIETATFAVSGTAVLDGAITMTATAATESLIVTGSTGGSFRTGNVTTDVFNASGYDGTINTGTFQAAVNYTGSSGSDNLTGSAASDILSTGAGVDNIVASDGDDTITLGDGADIIDFGDIEGNTAAAYNAGAGSTVTDFVAGAGGDILDLDQLTATGGYIETSNAITDLAAGTAYEVIVLGHTAFANVGAAEDAIAGQSTSTTDAVFVFFDSTAGFAKAVFDADIDADGNLTDTAVIANFSNITSLTGVQALTADNFDIA